MSVTSIRTVGEWLSQSHVIDPLSLLPRYPQFGQAPTICVTLAVFSLYKRVDIYITLMFTLKLADVGCGEINPRQDQRNKFCGHESSSSSRSMIHPTYYVYALKKKPQISYSDGL